MAVQNTQSSENVLAKSGSFDEEEFGPKLPPPGQSLAVLYVVYGHKQDIINLKDLLGSERSNLVDIILHNSAIILVITFVNCL